MNYRYSSCEIKYCLDLADVEVLVFGPEFISRMDEISTEIRRSGCSSSSGRTARRTRKTACKLNELLLPERAPGGVHVRRTTPRSTSRPARPSSRRQSCTATARSTASCLTEQKPPRSDEGGRVPLHPAALPHRRQDALVRLADDRRQGRAAARGQARVDPARGHGGEVHDRLAAGALGAGHPRRDRRRQDQARRLSARPSSV